MAKFVVVGHPNKGKSSVVATLAQNDHIGISALSGTTIKARHYALQIEGQEYYQLVDTPGFQRPSSLLSLLKQNSGHAAQRAQTIAQWLESTHASERFPDEFELLQPLMDEDAAIIYVVDGAKPYRPAFEDEMEILRWTGRPRMAIINPINGHDFVAQWQQALDQYFSLVRVFDPLQAPFKEQLALLDAFSQLRPQWQSAMHSALSALRSQRKAKIDAGLSCIIRGLSQLLSHTQQLEKGNNAEQSKVQIEAHYQQHLRELDSTLRHDIQASLNHQHVQSEALLLDVDNDDIFDQSQWRLWGLPKKQLSLLAAGSGAAAGALLDVAVGGASLMMGALIGSLASGGSVYLWGEQLAKLRTGKGEFSEYWQLGPVQNNAFAWSLLSRYLFLMENLLQRNHARRDSIDAQHLQDFSDAFRLRVNALSKRDQLRINLWLMQPQQRVVSQTQLRALLAKLLTITP